MKSPTVGLICDEKVNVLLISDGCKKKKKISGEKQPE
jgi:hypothetical protein